MKIFVSSPLAAERVYVWSTVQVRSARTGSDEGIGGWHPGFIGFRAIGGYTMHKAFVVVWPGSAAGAPNLERPYLHFRIALCRC